MAFWSAMLLGITTLLPLVNPFGSALVFSDMVGQQSPDVYRSLSWRVSLATFLFLSGSEYLGTALLSFFQLSLSVVQVMGGVVLAANGWRLLFQPDPNDESGRARSEVAGDGADGRLRGKVFYPFTFPITAGPGCFVAMLTLNARFAGNTFSNRVESQIGIIVAVAALCIAVYLCYSLAPRMLSSISPGTAHGVLRIISFLLLCIGGQILLRGLIGVYPLFHSTQP